MKVYPYLILSIFLAININSVETIKAREIEYRLRISEMPNLEENTSQNIGDGEPNLKDEESIKYKGITIELSQEYIITHISWTKTDDYNLNYILGVFEGAKELSFMDAIPLAIIKDQGTFNDINYINVDSPNSFRYIRYVAPNNNYTNVYPIKIYGYKKSEVKEEDLNEKKDYQATNLPLISIHTENSIEPQSFGGDINCSFTIINEGKIEMRENAEIKVRGKSTSFASPKKAFRVKFFSKQKIFNFKGKEKKWTLLANYFDRSLLRNSLAFKVSELMGLSFIPRCLPVDVIINGNFRGNYYICDKIEIGKNRINITKMEKTDNLEPNVTGGYLLQIDSVWRSDRMEPFNFKTIKGITGKIIYPEEDDITYEQKNYINYELNKLEEEVYNGILDSVDIDSYSKYFLIEEFCGDPDHVWSSFFFSKNRNDDKFRFGPAWDFDLAFDNDKRLYPTNNKTEFCLNYCDSAGTFRQFVKKLIGNKIVSENIKNIWEKLIITVLNEKILIEYLEEKKALLEESSALNFMKWYNVPDEDSGRRGMGFGRKDENFDLAVEVVKNYVTKRIQSLTILINNLALSFQ